MQGKGGRREISETDVFSPSSVIKERVTRSSYVRTVAIAANPPYFLTIAELLMSTECAMAVPTARTDMTLASSPGGIPDNEEVLFLEGGYQRGCNRMNIADQGHVPLDELVPGYNLRLRALEVMR